MSNVAQQHSDTIRTVRGIRFQRPAAPASLPRYPAAPPSDDRATARPAPFRPGKRYRLPDGDLVVVLCGNGDDTWNVRRADDTSFLPAHRRVRTADLGDPS